MDIQTIKYGNAEKTIIEVVTLDHGSAFMQYPLGIHAHPAVTEWLEAGNTIDPMYNEIELNEARIAAIKEEAGKRINEILPEMKQRNLLARMIELSNKDTLTDDEQAEADAAQAVWDAINDIRETSNTAETAMTPVGEIDW